MGDAQVLSWSKDALGPEWSELLSSEFDQVYMHELYTFLLEEKNQGKTIFPPEPLILNAFDLTHFSKVRVVILGQDPYHGSGQAHGLSFSVPKGVKLPPSLQNIFKELNRSLGVSIPNHGCLKSWAEQGVLLLNACLTVEQNIAGSHQGKGWERFTDAVIRCLDTERENLVFMLWGNYAQKKGNMINTNRHLVLRSAHPSPLSAHRGFLGNGHFSKANDYFKECGQTLINWGSLN